MGPFLSKEIMHLSVWCVLEFLLPFASSLFLYWRFFLFFFGVPLFGVMLFQHLYFIFTFVSFVRLRFLVMLFQHLCFIHVCFFDVSSVLGYVVLAPLLYSFKKQQQPVFLRIWVMLFQHLCFIHFCWSSGFFYSMHASLCRVVWVWSDYFPGLLPVSCIVWNQGTTQLQSGTW